MSVDELKDLLELPKYNWVKEDFLPAYHVLSKMRSEQGNGYQFLPTSEENLLLNLKGDIALSGLREFEQVFANWVDREEVEEGEYRTANVHPIHYHKEKYHSGTDYKIRITVTGSLLNIGKEQLKMRTGKWSIENFQGLLFFKYLLSNTNVKAIEDTGFLSVITKDEMWGEGYVRYKRSTKNLVRNLISCNKAFLSDVVLETITQELMREEFFYKSMDSIPGRCKAAEHHFNAVRCHLPPRYRYAVPSEIWSEIRTKIESIEYASVIKTSLSKIEEGYGDMVNEIKFLEILKNEKVGANNPMKTGDYESFSDVLERLNMDGVTKIASTGDIILLEEQTINTRIESREKEIAAMILRWLNEVVVPEPPIIHPDQIPIAFKLLSNFEIEFREFTIGQLKNRYGENWWKQGVKVDIKDKCEKRQKKDIDNKNTPVNIHNYMDFMDPYSLIDWKPNKDIFQPYFPKDLDKLRIKLSDLYDIRNDIAHSKKEITEKDVHTIEICVNEINRWIDTPSIKIEEQKPKDSLKIHIGDSTDGTPIYWEPDGADGKPRLVSGNILITGGAGSGKTEALKSILFELNKQGYICLALGFHPDLKIEGFKSLNITAKSDIGVNPLDFDSLDEDGGGLPTQIYNAVERLKESYPTIGDIQEASLIEILEEAYAKRGITEEKETWGKPCPNFEDVRNILEERISETGDKELHRLKNKLSKIFKFNIFSKPRTIDTKNLFNESTVLDLSKLPDDFRFLVADTILRKIYRNLVLRDPIGFDAKGKERFRIFIAIDEAKIIAPTKKDNPKAIINIFGTEARKFGVGFIVSSQLTAHFGDDVLGNMATKIALKPLKYTIAQDNAKELSINPNVLMDLKNPGEGFIRFSNEETKKVFIKSYEKRKEGGDL